VAKPASIVDVSKAIHSVSGAGLIGAALVSHPTPAAFAELGAIGAFIWLAMTLGSGLLLPRLTAYANAVNAGTGSGADGFKAKIEDNQNAQRSTLEAVRRLLDALADEVAAPLAALTTEYVNARKAPDGFFRGTARLLSDLTSEEFAALAKVLRFIRAFAGPRAEREVCIIFGSIGHGAEEPDRVRYCADDSAYPGKQLWEDVGAVPPDLTPHVPRVFQLLKVHAVAEDAQRWGTAPSFAMPRAAFLRLADLVCGTEAHAP
jgi:hypothetical protein